MQVVVPHCAGELASTLQIDTSIGWLTCKRQALYDMHSKKMVHMDVKLQNVLVGPGEVYKVRPILTMLFRNYVNKRLFVVHAAWRFRDCCSLRWQHGDHRGRQSVS